MNIDKLFPLTESRGTFLNGFANENLRAQATIVWNKLGDSTTLLIIIMLFVSIVAATIYYTVYNNRPGRHYKVIPHWVTFGGLVFIITLVLTMLLMSFGIDTKLPYIKLVFLYGMTALNNAIYGLIVYFIISLIWCNWLPTNACRFLKFK